MALRRWIGGARVNTASGRMSRTRTSCSWSSLPAFPRPRPPVESSRILQPPCKCPVLVPPMSDHATHFEPWVGNSFGVGPVGSKRLLILGEAHYSDQAADDRPSLTKELVGDVRNGRRSISFFTKLGSLLTSIDPHNPDPRGIWDQVAFYNFIQGFAASEARVRPTPAMWEAGLGPFSTVLRGMQPNRVLVTGIDLWNALSQQFMPGWMSVRAHEDDSQPVFSWSSATDTPIRATWIEHPSSFGFSGAAWSDRLAALAQ